MNLLHTFKLHCIYSHGTIVHQCNAELFRDDELCVVIIANSMVFSVACYRHFNMASQPASQCSLFVDFFWSWLRQLLSFCTRHIRALTITWVFCFNPIQFVFFPYFSWPYFSYSANNCRRWSHFGIFFIIYFQTPKAINICYMILMWSQINSLLK